ncbi:variant surface glycoprotein [Trypanosoma brucei equiperdum]|uniref:Variant surface glycoprotein n=1 Tax=Trypanosoma brucei equiperdum TaxID=630700 RepID=A0A3L6LDF5_9TRYP|nr:variant surface glycoprotein [Trypanosoma brucei equiperdum]RHW73891.1 variant surface glycoprotein [Trypanosoma brucei equiperdum]RHW73906.1 variant surface glycoprotein [Trypanosoma brucei equiperdum]RHW73930.1 variant surface glycoprotein [Trypanosoma brucei equiperdum]
MMMPFILIRKIATIAAASLCTIILQANAAATNGVNAATFHALCAALQLGDGAITIDPPIVSKPKPPTEIYTLNMTLADESWQKTLYKTGKDSEPPTAAQQPQNLHGDWKEKWSTWTTAAIAANTKGMADKIKKEHRLDAADASQLQETSVEISQIADASFDVYSAVANSEETKSDEDIIKELRDALTGDTQTGAVDTDGTKAFTTTGQNYAQACETGTTTAAKTALGALFCLCVVPNSQSNKPCIAEYTHPTWNVAGEPNSGTYASLRKMRQQRHANTISAHKVTAAVEAIENKLTGASSTAMLGEPVATCDGSNNGACIKYQNAAAGDVVEFNKIPWLEKMKTVAQWLKQREQQNAANKLATDEFDRLKRLVSKIATHATRRPKTPQAHVPTSTTNTANSKPQQETDCTKITNPDECKPDAG